MVLKNMADDCPSTEELFGVKSEPLFKKQADYDKFCQEFVADVEPKQRESRLAHARSELASMFRVVD